MGFPASIFDPMVRCTARLILVTQGRDSISADSSLHLCREFPNHGYPWIQLPKSRKKSTIKFISYASSAWWDICELFLAALKHYINLVTFIPYTHIYIYTCMIYLYTYPMYWLVTLSCEAVKLYWMQQISSAVPFFPSVPCASGPKWEKHQRLHHLTLQKLGIPLPRIFGSASSWGY